MRLFLSVYICEVKFQNDLALQFAGMVTCTGDVQTAHAPQCNSPKVCYLWG